MHRTLVPRTGAGALAWLAGALVLVASAVLLPGLVRGWLVVADEPRPADCILVLNHGQLNRAMRAAALYRAGLAPRLVLPDAEPELTARVRTLWRQLQVPDSAVTVLASPDPIAGTMDEARVFAAWAEETGVRRALVVTHGFHTRRSRWALQTAAGDRELELLMVPAGEQVGVRGEWRLRIRWMKRDAREMAKFMGYLVLHR